MKFTKVMFLHVSVILSTGGVSAPVHAGMHTPWDQRQAPPPRTRGKPPGTRGTHPPRSRRYASYWNAILFAINLSKCFHQVTVGSMRTLDFDNMNTVVILSLTAGQEVSVTQLSLVSIEGAIGNFMFSWFSGHLLFAQ